MPLSAAILRTDGATGMSADGFAASAFGASAAARGDGCSSAALIGAVVAVFWSGRPVAPAWSSTAPRRRLP